MMNERQVLNLLSSALLLQVVSGSLGYLALADFPVNARLAQIKPNTSQDINQLQEQATQLRESGNYPEALQLYQKVLKLRRELGDRIGEGDTLNAIGTVYEYLNSYPEALKAYQEALQIRRFLRDLEGVGNTLANMGELYRQQGEYDRALEVLQESLLIRTEASDRAGVAETLGSVASVYHQRGVYQKALETYQQALDIFEALKDETGKANVLGNLGSVYISIGQYERALSLYEQSLPILQKIDDKASVAGVLHNIGLARARLKQYPQALEFYKQALSAYKNIGYRIGEASTLNNIGFAYAKLNRNESALVTLEKALRILQEIGDRSGEAKTLDSIGTAYRNLRKDARAIDSYQNALTIARKIGDREVQRVILGNIGEILEKQNQPELAVVFYKRAVNISESMRQELRTLSREEQESFTKTVSETYRTLADLLLKQNRVSEAQRVLDLLKVQELQDYLRDVRGNNQTALGIEISRTEREIIVKQDAIIDKAIEIKSEETELRQIPAASRTPSQEQRLVELIELRQQVTEEFNEFISSREVKALVEQIRRNTNQQNFNLASLNRLQSDLKKLQQNAVMLYPLVLDNRLELVLVTADAPPIHRSVSLSSSELNKVIAKFRPALTKSSSETEAKALARQLYNWLIKPIEPELKAAKAKTIIYAPDGVLRYIPLAALHDGERWLVERFRVNNITARSLTDFTTVPRARPQVLAGAFTRGSYNFTVGSQLFQFNGLEYAGREVDEIATSIPGTTKLLNSSFNRDAIVPTLNKYSIIHFATHAAFVKGQPEESFILFGDGNRANLRDIGNWSLRNADLVVLSACQTALGSDGGSGSEIGSPA